jgi:hypothetical protein
LLDQGINPAETIPDPFGRIGTNGQTLLVTRQSLLQPYPLVGGIEVAGITSSNSIYHAGTVELERRFAKGVGFRFNYAFSKSIDNTSDSNLNAVSFGSFGATQFQDALDLKGNRSPSNFDARHRFNYVASYLLPVGKGQKLLGGAGRLLNLLVGGWQLNGVGSLRSGYPFQVGLGDLNGFPTRPGTSTIGIIYNQQYRPDIIPGVPVINPLWNKSVANTVPYINPATFSRPAYDHTGDAARTLDYARYPWVQSLDLSMMKNLYPFENTSRFLQLRIEAYNVLNHAAFIPSTQSTLFNTSIPISPTGLSLAGPIPYCPAVQSGQFPVGSRQQIDCQYYNPAFGVLTQSGNAEGRSFQIALRLYF